MTLDQISIISILVIVLALFLWGKIRYDVVALIALFLSALVGVVSPQEMFSGFGHPATITVAFVLVLSYGLTRSSAVEGITQIVAPLSSTPILHMSALILIAAFFSMFMNNVGALALLMPVAIESSINANRSPSTVLMPLAFGSILGGLATLIGTPPNIIISTYREEVTGEAFSMFDFTPVGGVVALVGILFIIVIGWRFVAKRKSSVGADVFDIESYLFQAKIKKDSLVKNKTIRELIDILDIYDITMNGIIEKKTYIHTPSRKKKLQSGAILVLEGASEDVDKFISKQSLTLLGADSDKQSVGTTKETIIMEVVIAPDSMLLDGKKVSDIKFNRNHGLNLLAISREGNIQRTRIREFTLRVGDVLLVEGEQENIEDKIKKVGCIPLANRGLSFGQRKKAVLALGIFIGAIACALIGLASIQICLGVAMVAMILTNIVPTKEIYHAIDWPVIVLLGAMIPIGGALESTGTTQLIAGGLILLASKTSLTVILAIILIVTMTLSDVLNNATTAIFDGADRI